MDHFQLKDGILHCEDVPLPAIAEAVGTPVYVYSTATMERHARVFRAAVADCGPDPLVAFGELEQDVLGGIGGAVLRNDDLEVAERLVEDRAERRRQVGLRVVRRDDDGDEGVR